MRVRVRAPIYFVLALMVVGVSTARAQDAGWSTLSLSGGRMDYDLSGTGNAPAFSIRTTRNLMPHLRLELGGVYAKPDQQFGPSTLFIPEAQLQFHWNLGRVAPFVGGGIGTALVKSSFHTDWDPTFSAAAGTMVRVTDALGISGELRLRGHEARFTGTSAEVLGGLTWQFSSF